MEDSEPKHGRFGTPMGEWINLVGELDIDAVGLWQIVPAGREGFGLQGPTPRIANHPFKGMAKPT